MIKRLAIRSAFAILLLSVIAPGHTDDERLTGVEALSPELRQLLNQEMLAIQQGMMAILPALAAGDYQQIAKIAGQIKQSYILKQRLSEAQRDELHQKLPASFIALDMTFHGHAGMLQHAASMKNAELSSFYFYKLTEACAGCHSQFARHKFPALAPSQPDAHHHH